jgi:hypothetical protein
METLRVAYALAKKNDGAPGIDGVTFDDIEKQGVEAFLEQIRDELTERNYADFRCADTPGIMHLMQFALGMMDEDGLNLRPIFEGADRDPGRW